MAKNRYVNTRFWDDAYTSNLDPIEKLLFLYLLTNPLTNMCGIYEIGLTRMAFDTGIDKEMILKIIERFSKDDKIFYVDSYIAIKNFTKHQKNNTSINKGIQESLKFIPEKIKSLISFDSTSLYLVIDQRKAIAVRDKFICGYCQKKIIQNSDFVIDHVYPESRGGKSTYINLICSCDSCNKTKSDKSGIEFGFPDIKPKDYHINIAYKELKENPELLNEFNFIFNKTVIFEGNELIDKTSHTDTEGHHLNSNINLNSNTNSNLNSNLNGNTNSLCDPPISFIDELINIFCIEYLEAKGIEYIIQDKDKKGVGMLLAGYKKKNKESDTEKAKTDFTNLFRASCNINDEKFLSQITLAQLNSHINQYLNYIKNGRSNKDNAGFNKGFDVGKNTWYTGTKNS